MNEDQYYQPIMNAILATKQRQQQADQLKAEVGWRNQQNSLAQARLKQDQAKLDAEHEYQESMIQNMHSQQQAENLKQLKDFHLNGGNDANFVQPGQPPPMQQTPSLIGSTPSTMSTGTPEPMTSVGGQQIPISKLPQQSDMMAALQRENQAKVQKYKVHPELQKPFSEGGMGLPEEAPKEMIDQGMRLYEARAMQESNLKNKSDALDKTVEMKRDLADQATQRRLDGVALMAAVRGAAGGNKEDMRGDRSYQFHVGQLQKEAIPIDTAVSRYSRLTDTLNQNNPIGDSTVAPELLSMVAGGANSGLRMTQPEINAIVGGRNNWESLQAWAQKYSTDPSKGSLLSPAQRQQIRGLSDAVGKKLMQKQSLIKQANGAIANTNDPIEHRQIFSKLQNDLAAVDSPVTGPVTFKSPSGATKEITDPEQIMFFRNNPKFTEVKK